MTDLGPNDGAPASMPGAESHPRSADRAAVARAVQERLQKQAEQSSHQSQRSPSALDEPSFIQKLSRSLNAISTHNSFEATTRAFSLLLTLVSNVLEHPDELRYRSFRSDQRQLRTHLLDLAPHATGAAAAATDATRDAGVQPALVLMGWRTRRRDFREEWYLPTPSELGPPASSSPTPNLSSTSSSSSSGATTAAAAASAGWRRLQLARDTLRTRLEEREVRAEHQRIAAQAEREREKNRKARALEEAREDRERVAARVERERMARQVQQQQQQQQQQQEAQEAQRLAEEEQRAQEHAATETHAQVPGDGGQS